MPTGIYIRTEKHRQALKVPHKGSGIYVRKPFTLEHRINMGKNRKGENSPVWIKDRTKLVKRQERNDYSYIEWRKQVWLRDNFKCKIANQDCKGKIEAHHILGWSLYPELRYELTNGITLCHAHHPRKRAEEIQMIPRLSALIGNNV